MIYAGAQTARLLSPWDVFVRGTTLTQVDRSDSMSADIDVSLQYSQPRALGISRALLSHKTVISAYLDRIKENKG